jgi:hypothetical protein
MQASSVEGLLACDGEVTFIDQSAAAENASNRANLK